MNKSDKYHCELGHEVPLNAISLCGSCLEGMKNQRNALLDFVKYIASGQPKDIKFKDYGFEYSANVILKEIGEG